MSEMSDFSKFELQVAISCNLKIFIILHNGPSALLAKLIRSSRIEFKLRKNLIYDANGINITREYYCLCTFVFYYRTMLIIQVKLSLCFETINNRLPSPSIV